MFYVISKIFWFIAAPTNFLLLCVGFGVACLYTRFSRLGRALSATGIVALLLLSVSPLPRIILRPLEDRFPQNVDDRRPIHGIVVLGGAVSKARGTIQFNETAERMTESARLALLHPEAKLVFSGGSTNLISDVSWTEAGEAGIFYQGLGIRPERMILEEASRNTYENAIFTARMIRPKPGERWLLITSAYHMPRSMGVFRKAGLDLEAWPVDYNSTGTTSDYLRPNSQLSRRLLLADNTVKEYIGLLAYRFSGYMDALFPAP
jgi:uncharacterized SAM-binding protein YcdF (DUF218 family)